VQRFRIGSGPISALAAATGGQVRRRGIPIDEEVRAADIGRGEVPVKATFLLGSASRDGESAA
jgi:hypothetical protein